MAWGSAAPGKAKHTPAVIPFLAQNLPADLTTGVMLVAVIPMTKCPSTARGIFVAGRDAVASAPQGRSPSEVTASVTVAHCVLLARG